MSWRAALAVGVAACDPCPPLSHVPIRGFDGASYEIVMETLRSAEADLALPVCIDHVQRGGIVSNAWGVYNPVTHGVRIARDAHPDDLHWILLHEICHGVDRQNDVVKRHEAAFDEIADPPDGARWRGRAESMALLCDSGPGSFEPLWDQQCPDDPDLEGDRVIREEVYGYTDAAPEAWFEPIAGYPVPEGPTSYELTETVDGDLALVGGWFGGLVAVVDPFTGEPVASQDEPALTTPTFPLAPAPPDGWSASGIAISGGPIDAHTQVLRALHRDSEALRLLVLTDDGWAPADAPCPDASHTFFLYEGELWSSQVFGTRLQWGRWHSGRRPQGQ